MTAPSVTNKFGPDAENVGPRINANFDDLVNWLAQRNNGSAAWDNFVTLGPWVDVRAYASINAAVTAIGSTQTTLLVPNAQTLTANLTIPSTLSLWILKGGSIVKASTFTLTINGPFFAGRYTVFSGFSAGNVTGLQTVFPEWFGALADGSTNDLSAMTVAANATSTGTIDLNAGKTYKINGEWDIPANVSVEGNGATIDGSSATGLTNALIFATGSISSAIGGGFTGAITAGFAGTLTFNSSPGLAAGDLILVRDTDDGSWYAGFTDARKGEYMVVKTVSGNDITVTSSVIDSYPSDATVYLVTSTRSSFRNFIVQGNPSDTSNKPSLCIDYGRDNKIEDIRFLKTVQTGVEIKRSFNVDINHIETGKYAVDGGGVESLGVTANGQHIKIRNSYLVAHRAGASTAGGGFLISRFVVFENNFLSGRSGSAADFHPAGEFCSYRNNFIWGLINLSGARNEVCYNIINDASSPNGQTFNFEFIKCLDHKVIGNRIITYGNAQVVEATATDDLNTNTTENGTFQFEDNDISDYYDGNKTYIFIQNQGSTTTNRLYFKNNIFRKVGTGTKTLFAISAASGSDFNEVIFEGTKLDTVGLGSVANVTAFIGRHNIGASASTENANPNDDHTQYLLASSATSRAAFAANWTDLTDGGATTLHKHDHGNLDGLADDDHTQYGLLAGRSGGQTLIGGTAANNDLTLQSTSNATRGEIACVDDFKLTATKKLYYDTGNDTFDVESSADVLDRYTGGTLRTKWDADGNILQPTQPSFLVTDNAGTANVTGDNTDYSMTWNAEIYDQGGDFASNTFTAPIGGRYYFSASVQFENILAAHTNRIISLTTSNRSYRWIFNTSLAETSRSMHVCALADMDASDTAIVEVRVSGSTKTVDIAADASLCNFSGSLVN